jgi:hypothetical protein
MRRLAHEAPAVESALCAGAIAWAAGRLEAIADKLDEFDGTGA